MNLKIAALYMGYREVLTHKFLKPIGNSCLAIDLDNLCFICYFKAGGKLHVWSSNTFDNDCTAEEYIEVIKYFETYKTYLGHEESNFHFLDPEQLFEYGINKK